MSLVFQILISILLIYIVVMILSFFFQDRLIFLSNKLKEDHHFEFEQSYEEYNIDVAQDVKINALLFKSSETPKGLIVYFHGNADNLRRWGRYSKNFTDLSYDVLMIDYRGYGKSSGIPTETNLYNDAEFIWEWSKKTFNYNKHIIYGRSLGAAVATKLAASANPDLLIMETPFDRLNGAVPAYIIPFKLKYDFENTTHLQNVNCEKVIFHGSRDLLIPLSSALRLKQYLNGNDKMIIIKKGRHKNLDSFPAYHEELQNILL